MINDNEMNEFEEYTRLEGSEIGDVCSHLLSLYNNSDYISDEFKEALEKEILIQLEEFKDCFEIEEVEETIVNKYKQLNWIGCYDD